jgi:hypothetical protein
MGRNLGKAREKFNKESKNQPTTKCRSDTTRLCETGFFRVVCVFCGLLSKQPQQQRQNRAQNQAGDDGKMKTEIALGITDVAGQTSEPAFAEARPQQRAHRRQQQPGNHQKFAQVVHNSKMAREAREGNEGFLTRISPIDTNLIGEARRAGIIVDWQYQNGQSSVQERHHRDKDGT